MQERALPALRGHLPLDPLTVQPDPSRRSLRCTRTPSHAWPDATQITWMLDSRPKSTVARYGPKILLSADSAVAVHRSTRQEVVAVAVGSLSEVTVTLTFAARDLPAVGLT
jgi:hypothetical protein